MTPTVQKTPCVIADIDNIAAFITLDNLQAAIRFVELLEEKFQLLAASPGMGRPRPDLGTELRGFPVDGYVIFYRETDRGIDVVRVLHGARDIESLFRDTALTAE